MLVDDPDHETLFVDVTVASLSLALFDFLLFEPPDPFHDAVLALLEVVVPEDQSSSDPLHFGACHP